MKIIIFWGEVSHKPVTLWTPLRSRPSLRARRRMAWFSLITVAFMTSSTATSFLGMYVPARNKTLTRLDILHQMMYNITILRWMQCTLLWLRVTCIPPFHNLHFFQFIVNMKIKFKSTQVRFICTVLFTKQIGFLYCDMYHYCDRKWIILWYKIRSGIIFIRLECYSIIIPEQATAGLKFDPYLLHVSGFIYECLSRKCLSSFTGFIQVCNSYFSQSSQFLSW